MKTDLNALRLNESLFQGRLVAQKFFLNAEHQSSTYGYVLSPRLGSMHRCLLFSKSARLLILPLMLESNQSARTEPRPTVRSRTIQKPSRIDGGRGETISFGWNDCRRLARRRYCLGPSIRCGAVVPARKLNPYFLSWRDIYYGPPRSEPIGRS